MMPMPRPNWSNVGWSLLTAFAVIGGIVLWLLPLTILGLILCAIEKLLGGVRCVWRKLVRR